MMEWIRFEAIIVVDYSCSYRTMEFQYIRCVKIIGQVKGDGKGNRKDECKEMEDSSHGVHEEMCKKKKKKEQRNRGKQKIHNHESVTFHSDGQLTWFTEFHVYNENQCNNLHRFSFLFYFSFAFITRVSNFLIYFTASFNV